VTDAELAEVCCPSDPAKGLRFVAALTPEKRALLERMEDVYQRMRLYEEGLGPKPTDVRICGVNEIREGRGPKQRRRK
jgi:hypothetical protein